MEHISENDGIALLIQADVSQKNQFTNLLDKTIESFGKVDVLVNNTGIMYSKLLKDNTPEEFSKLFDVNVRGIFNTLQEAESKLADNGSIINFSSSTAKLMFPTYALYSVTKEAVEQMTFFFLKKLKEAFPVMQLL